MINGSKWDYNTIMIMKAFKWIFIGSVISLLIVGFGTFLIVDKFFWMKDWYWSLKEIIRYIQIGLTILTFSSVIGLLICSLLNFNKQNGLK